MSRQDGFPDVTLAEQRPLNPPNANSNFSSNSKDTVVILQRREHLGYFLSRTRTYLLGLCAVLILAVSILLTAFLVRESCKCHEGHGLQNKGNFEPHSKNPSMNRTSSVFLDPSKFPWSGLRLPRSILPAHYDLILKVNLNTSEFSGSCNITAHVNTSTRYIVFHRSDLAINESQVKVRSDYHHPWHIVKQYNVTENQFHVLELNRTLPAGLKIYIEVAKFSGVIRDDLRGLYQSSYKTPDGQVKHLVSSQLQSTDARRVFPCFDEPDFKATFRISVIHQRGYEAFSNMPVKNSQILDVDWVRKDFELRVWARPDAYDQTKHALEFGVETYKFFTDYFGIPDTVPKADHVAVPDFSAGAMENWGLVIYRETALLYDKMVSSSSNKYMVTLIVAHEIAHTWFGNMATMRWWDDLWLNEGFASSLMYIAMDHVYPEWNVFAIQVVEDIFPVMVKDALITSHPVSTEIKDPEDIQQFFDIISYNKGMAILRMLKSFIGPNCFRKGLQMYVRRYKFKNAAMDELWQTFTEAVNGTFNVERIMGTWTRQMGYPLVMVKDEGNYYLLQQSRFLLHDNSSLHNDSETPYGYKWYIPFTYVTENSPANVKMTWLNMDSAKIPKDSGGWLLGNYEYTGFFRVLYEIPMWEKLADQLLRNHSIFPEASRAGLIGDAFAFSRANLLDYDVTLNLTRYLKNEMSYVPWRAFLDAMEFLRGMLAAQEAYVHLERYLRRLVEPVFDKVIASSQGSLSEQYVKRIILSIACDVGLEKAVTYAKTFFQEWMEFGNRPPPDLSLSVYSVGVREGGVKEWDFVWNKTQSTTVASEREMMMEALAQTQKSFLLWRFSEDAFMMREVIQEVTTYVNTDFQLRQLERLFHEKPLKTASKATGNALALIRANIDWMKRNYEKISYWLQHNVT
ncbi:hypothetical protein C0Q70_03541 [Pomacea canaliculata]|uniref:Aminopeptidase n=1 Tax=Pomacea canaliculata TaxID=400727 RepID=A0A2T7PT05_POMCA|nr:hypothetical protein C0Q70_03541 [Pomacea canaliculata]